MHLKVGAVNLSHSFVIEEVGKGCYRGLDGMDFELLTILSKVLKFTYELVVPKDQEFGSLKEDGEWTGIVGLLSQNKADMSINGLILTYENSRVIKFVLPHNIDFDTFAIRKASLADKENFYVHPFQFPVWSCFAVCLLVCSILLSCFQSSSMSQMWTKQTRFRTMLCVAETLIGSGSRFSRFLKRGSTRLILALYALPFRVLMLSYTSLMLSFLMAPIMEDQVKTIDELAKASRTGKFKVTVPVEIPLYQSLQAAETETMVDLGKNLLAHPETVLNESSAVVEMIGNDYAVMGPNMYITIKTSGSIDGEPIFISKDSLKISLITMLFRKEFCCTNQFNEAILSIYQSGIYQKIVRDKMFHLNLKRKLHEVEKQSIRSITVKDLVGVFKLLNFGFALAFVVLIYERFCTRGMDKKKHRKRKNISKLFRSTLGPT